MCELVYFLYWAMDLRSAWNLVTTFGTDQSV